MRVNRARGAAVAATLLGIVCAPAVTVAAEAKLAWDPPLTNTDGTPLTDLAGYKIYYGLAPETFDGQVAKEGPSPVDVPLAVLGDKNKPSFALTGLPSCQHFYFAATAYNTAGEESEFSNRADAVIAHKPAVKVTLEGGTMQVSWTAKGADDTGSISGYRVHYDIDPGEPYKGIGASLGDAPIDIAAGTTTVELDGLPPGTWYLAVETTCPEGRKLSEEVSVSLAGGGEQLGPDDPTAGILLGGCSTAPGQGQVSWCWLLLLLLAWRSARSGSDGE